MSEEVFAKKDKDVAKKDKDVAKKDKDVVPLVSCESWTLPCVLCDRRFGEWRDAREKNLAKIPDKPGILKIGLKYRGMVEVVNIILNIQDIRKVITDCMDQAKKVISEDKKYRYKWPVVVCRWITFKRDNEKPVAILCAHWYNSCVLPYLQKDWPGLDILQKTDCLTFSDQLQKWCYSKTSFCNKPVEMEVVKGCTWLQCETCDSYFTKWKRLDSVVTNDIAPASYGIFMIAVSCERHIKVIKVVCGSFNIKYALECGYKHRENNLIEKEYAGRNAFFIVRWMEFQDGKSDSSRSLYVHWLDTDDSSCSLYAHWLNSDHPVPLYPYLPVKEVLKKNQNFVFRTSDNKWCYVVDTFKHAQTKTTSKQKKYILNELKEDILYLDCFGA